jgi:prepilin-type N-terminal cleavage/methylation domain-containing protein
MRRASAAKRGFTLIEALVVIAVLGLVATVVVPSITQSPDAAKKAKLEQDIVMVNNAIDAYLAAGGSQGGLSAEGAVETLKQRVTATVTTEMTGELGPFLDPRVVTAASDFGWSARFVTGAQPRFVIQNTPDGVVFERGLPTAVGGPTASTKPSWLWSYAEAEAGSVSSPVFEPAAVDTGTTLGVTNSVLAGLSVPSISPASQTLALSGFPLAVSIGNPNPSGSSIVYYRIDEGSWVLWVDSPFNVNPGSTVTAVAVSIDPSRYYNSPAVSAAYSVIPLQLSVSIDAPASITYAQAGGAMIGQAAQLPPSATISLAGGVPPPYISSANFQVRYTSDGSDPRTSSTAVVASNFSGAFPPVSLGLGLSSWGTNNSLTVRAAAVSLRPDWFTGSPMASATVSPQRVSLDPPIVSPTNQVVTFSVTVVMSNPATGPSSGMSVRYTTNNTAPTAANGFTYSSPFSLSSFGVNEQKPVRASTVVTGSLTNWFNQSAETTRVYTGPAFGGSGLPSGALVGSATLNSTFNGNVTVAYPSNGVVANITYNANAVINGSLYVPGTPRIAQNSPFIPQWTLANDAQFANRIYGIVEGQSPSPRVVDLNGPVAPTNYVITFNNNSYITGKIFRRSERYTLTPLNVATFPVKPSSASLSLSGPVANPLSASNVANVTLNTTSVGSVTLLPGTYGNMTANNNSKFVLGNAADPETPVVYNFDSLTLNSGGDVVIVGRVILNIRNSFALSNGAVFGNVDRPDWLQINVWSSSNINVASGSSVYGRIFAPNNTIAFNNGSTLNGSVSARNLELNSSSVVFSLSPANSPGP